MAYLPGEKMLLELTQKGQDSHQAVGHLTDGTMVVVEHANKLIGKTVEIEFIRSLQTAAGKMMFAKLVERPAPVKATFSKAVKATRPPRVQQVATPVVATVEAPTPAPVVTAFHSDQNDQRLARRSNKPSAPRGPRPPRTPQELPYGPETAQSRPQTPRVSKKPRTSAQNEDDLIRLLNSQ
jgi:hypothetical protein